MADAIEQEAGRVRFSTGRRPVHELVEMRFDRHAGWLYLVGCDLLLRASKGAMLTTRRATCGECLSRPPSRVAGAPRKSP